MPYQYKREPLSHKETGHLTGSPIKKNLLITGLPGVGKTTLIKKLSEELKHLHPAGFYTEEIREAGQRKGFELISLDGKRGLLSHIHIKSPHRVGKYKVDIEAFENLLDEIPFFSPSTHLIVIDEIGKMECLSDPFKNLLKKILDSEKLVIATIPLKSGGFIEKIKKRPDVKLFELKQSSRNDLPPEILREVKESDRRND
jgi:nucleoside-triphosphatase